MSISHQKKPWRRRRRVVVVVVVPALAERERARATSCCGCRRSSRSGACRTTCASELIDERAVPEQRRSTTKKPQNERRASRRSRNSDDARARCGGTPVIAVEPAQLGVLREVLDRRRSACRRVSSARIQPMCDHQKPRCAGECTSFGCRSIGGGGGGARPTRARPSARASCRAARARTGTTRLVL